MTLLIALMHLFEHDPFGESLSTWSRSCSRCRTQYRWICQTMWVHLTAWPAPKASRGKSQANGSHTDRKKTADLWRDRGFPSVANGRICKSRFAPPSQRANRRGGEQAYRSTATSSRYQQPGALHLKSATRLKRDVPLSRSNLLLEREPFEAERFRVTLPAVLFGRHPFGTFQDHGF
jgi:hypothetical protein